MTSFGPGICRFAPWHNEDIPNSRRRLRDMVRLQRPGMRAARGQPTRGATTMVQAGEKKGRPEEARSAVPGHVGSRPRPARPREPAVFDQIPYQGTVTSTTRSQDPSPRRCENTWPAPGWLVTRGDLSFSLSRGYDKGIPRATIRVRVCSLSPLLSPRMGAEARSQGREPLDEGSSSDPGSPGGATETLWP